MNTCYNFPELLGVLLLLCVVNDTRGENHGSFLCDTLHILLHESGYPSMEKIRFDFLQDFIIIDRPTNSTKGFTMHMAVVLRNGKTVIDSGFMFDVHREDGELAYNMKMNPVRVLEDFFDNERFRILCEEIWLGDWVLNCSTGKIVLHNDYTSRWPGRGNK